LSSKVYGINSCLKQIDPNLYTKGAAQAKTSLNGKAQPFLTTGGEAVTKRKILLKKNTRSCSFVSQITQTRKIGRQGSRQEQNAETSI